MRILSNRPKTNSLLDVIRCDEPSYLIWKWHPTDSDNCNSHRENSIRWGSALRVKDGEVAVFVYRQKNGLMQDFIVGPFDQIIKTANFPVLSRIIGLAYAGDSPFQAEVYFINIARIIQVKFGIPFFDIYDPRFLDFGVPVAVRGTIHFNIQDYREFIKLHRLISFSLDDFQKQIQDTTMRYVKDTIANVPMTHNIPLVQIETKVAQINNIIETNLSERLNKEFGINVLGVDIGTIEIDKSSDGFHQLMAITKNVTSAKIEAETEDYVERLRIRREEEQYAVHKQTQSANIGLFQIQQQTDVGIAGAEALSHMGENGAGNVNIGNGGVNFNPASIAAEMALGGVVGQNIARIMNTSMTGVDKIQSTPPPIPSISYHIAIDGKPFGPFDFDSLVQMASTGQLTANSLVWKTGMSEWVKAESIDELKSVFASIPPAIPTDH